MSGLREAMDVINGYADKVDEEWGEGTADDLRAATALLTTPPNPPRGACALPPPGWWCSLDNGHSGPCPAREESDPPGAGDTSKMDAIFAAYHTWPADIRQKLSVHDLRRMTGWTPPRTQRWMDWGGKQTNHASITQSDSMGMLECVIVDHARIVADKDAEIAELRQIVSACALYAGGVASPKCSMAFMRDVPKEVEHTSKRAEALEGLLREAGETLEEAAQGIATKLGVKLPEVAAPGSLKRRIDTMLAALDGVQ